MRILLPVKVIVLYKYYIVTGKISKPKWKVTVDKNPA